MKTINELKEFLHEFDLEDCLYLSEEETISAIIGFEDASRCLVYDYDKLVESFMEHFRKYDKENADNEEALYESAAEWVNYNTLRSLPYKQYDFSITDENNNVIETFQCHQDAEKKLNTMENKELYYITERELKMPIIIHSIEQFGF